MTNKKLPKINIGTNIKDILLRIYDYLGRSGVTKLILIIFLLIFMYFAYHSSSPKEVSMDKLEDNMFSQTSIKDMKKCTNRQLMQFMEMDYSNYDSYIYYKSKEALGVSELLIVKAYDKNQIPSINDAIDNRISRQIKTFEGYGPAQVNMLNNAIIFKRGKYIFYCVDKSPEQYLEVLKDAI